MEVRRTLLLASAAVFIFLLASCQPAVGEELSPSSVVSYIQVNRKIHLVLEAIRANGSFYANYIVSQEEQRTILMLAALSGRYQVVEELLKQGADVNAQEVASDSGEQGDTALIKALNNARGSDGDYERVVDILLEANANVSLPEAPLLSPLHHAAISGRRYLTKAILAKKPDLERQDSNGRTPLIAAASQVANTIDLLIEAGADVNAQDYEGKTALVQLLARNYMSRRFYNLIDQLIEAKADLELPEAPAWGPLHEAVNRDNHYAVEKLTKAGANVARKDREGRTPLLLAAEQGKSVLPLLLSAGSDVEQKNNDGETALTLSIAGYSDTEWVGPHKMQPYTNFMALLQGGADIKVPGPPGSSPLHLAAKHDAPGMARVLIAAGADIEREDETGKTPLLTAATSKSRVLSILLDKGAKVDHQDNDDDTALTLLIESVSTYENQYLRPMILLKSLLKAGADVELPESPATGPLHRAAKKGLNYFVAKLTEAGANVHREDPSGMTPLIIASENLRYRDRGVIKALLDAGAKVNHQDSEGRTALSRSLDKNPIVIYDAVNSLLAAAADVELPPEPAKSPLQEVASKSDNHRLLEQLIEAGADVNRTSATGKTALMYSATGGKSGADLLIDAGVDINAKDDAGESALLLACKSGRSESQSLFVDHLLEKGADVDAASATGRTALHEAANNGLPYVCRRLVESGASVYAVDYQGYTPLMSVAPYLSHKPLMIEILLAAGSDINHKSNTDGTIVHLLVTVGDARSLKLVMGFCPDLTKTNDQAQTPLALAQSRSNSEELIDIMNAKYTASCVYDLKIYKEGDRWCDHKTSKAYECLSNCQSQEIVGGLPECVTYRNSCLLKKVACGDPSIRKVKDGSCGSGRGTLA